MSFIAFHDILRWLHIGPAFVGLAVFWIPLVANKGGRLHRATGSVFVLCACLVGFTALVSCLWGLADPVSFGNLDSAAAEDVERLTGEIRFLTSFLAFLGAATLCSAYLGVHVVRTRRHPDSLDCRTGRAMILLVVVTALGMWTYAGVRIFSAGFEAPLLLHLGLGAVGLFGAAMDWRYIVSVERSHMDWWYKHMESMLGCCIGFLTAFMVFGANRVIGDYLHGPWAILPWVLPSAIGVPATQLWLGAYRRRFRQPYVKQILAARHYQ